MILFEFFSYSFLLFWMLLVVDIFLSPLRSQHVSRDRGYFGKSTTIPSKQIHIYTWEPVTPPRIKQVVMDRCIFSCMRSPPILTVMKILHIQILRLQSSMILASTTSSTKDINIPSFPTRKEEKFNSWALAITTYSAINVVLSTYSELSIFYDFFRFGCSPTHITTKIWSVLF